MAYQFRGIINELYLTDLKKKTHRGQMGQVLRGFSVGQHGYGFTTVPEGEAKYDTKGRLRADGFKLVIVAEEARIVQRIFRSFNDCKAITRIAKELNDENVPTKVGLKGGWSLSTVARIVKDEKYIGRFIWNRTMTVKDPLTGKIKKVPRPKEDWVIQERSELRIVSDEEWLASRTEKSALALRRLTGPVTLTPEKPDVGLPFFKVRCNVDSLNRTGAVWGPRATGAPVRGISQASGPVFATGRGGPNEGVALKLCQCWARNERMCPCTPPNGRMPRLP